MGAQHRLFSYALHIILLSNTVTVYFLNKLKYMNETLLLNLESSSCSYIHTYIVHTLVDFGGLWWTLVDFGRIKINFNELSS